jgi:DNA helicase-2/ATP-dependent DNA helicase PcrA
MNLSTDRIAEPLVRLNPEQRTAVAHFEGPILVLAGAGSGKTRVLTTRIAQLIQDHGVDPSLILAVTFTNKAAGEMRERVRRLLAQEPAGMWIGTFHSMGARWLRRHASLIGWSSKFSITDADQSLREVKRTMETLGISEKAWHPKAVQSAISAAKNALVGTAEYERLAADPFSRVVAEVYRAYQKSLKEQNAFDFDDLLAAPIRMFEENGALLERYRSRFRFILVDEYQDTNRAQYRLLSMLASAHGNLMVVGDDDQSIYGWRGADVRNILDFEQEFPGAAVVRLEQNYRSTGTILDVANMVIADNTKRKGKTLRTDAGRGEIVTRVEAVDDRDEAEWIAGEIVSRRAQPDRSFRDFVILYRTNSQSRSFEEAFRRIDVPYQIVGGTRFYERREIMDVLAYLRLISNPLDAGAFDRIVNYPRRGIGSTTQTKLVEWAAARGVSLLDAAVRASECSDLRAPAPASLAAFGALIQRYSALASHLTVGDLLERLLDEVGIIEALHDEGPEGEDRIENVRELLAGAREFLIDDDIEPEDRPADGATSLELFLQKVSLLTDVDRHELDAEAVTLMTMHNAKGLEYPFVFLSGLEDGLFPMSRSFDDPDALEEERRLFYVGVTRAERKLYLTHARRRRRGGEFIDCIPSRFLRPIDERLVEYRTTPQLERSRLDHSIRDYGNRGSFGGRRSESRSAGASSGTSPFEGDDGRGVYIDYTDAQDVPRFVKGERVRHPQFGRGTIRELSGFGQDLKAAIDFDNAGRKKVVVRYANLQKEL